MIIAITGGTGFIGRKLVAQHLAQGDSVRVLTRKQPEKNALSQLVQVFQGDLTNNKVDLHPFIQGTDILYHCAGEIIDSDKMYEVNVAGTRKLIAAAEGQISRWIQLSSVATYGTILNGTVTEKAQIKPDSTYGKTKAESDRLIYEASNRDSFTYSILRPSSVFGPSMNNKALFHMISAIDKRYFFFVGKPGANINCTHVNNVVKALMLCGKMPLAKNRVYNLSDHINMEHFVRLIATTLGKPVPKMRLPEKPIMAITAALGSIPRFPLNTSRVNALTTRATYLSERIKLDLGYSDSISLEDGLKQLVEIWRQEH